MKPALIISSIFFVVTLCHGQQRNFRSEVTSLRSALQEHHFSPRKIDDSFSSQVYRQIFSNLDPDKIYFTKEDVQALAIYENLLDDEINGLQWSFLNKLKGRFNSSLTRASINIEEILKNVDLKQAEYFEDNKETFETDNNSLATRQRRWLKHLILQRISTIAERDSTDCLQTFATKKTDAIKRVRASVLNDINFLLESDDRIADRVGRAFFDAITALHDPHTAYFSPSELKDFIGKVATEDYYFGFSLDENKNGEVIISAIAPGSPAWKSGELHAEDVIMSLKSAGIEDVDVGNMNLDEANEVLDNLKSDIIDLTVKKSDRSVKTIRLKKAKMESEENFVRSYILDGKNKFGYIHLPSFYTRWGDESQGSRCANDVAKEIIKLKKDGIEGLILDLRFNGGGSLYEAMALTGIFIDEGPLTVLRRRDKATTLKDMNRGTVYDGPLVIMVNGRSASASELVSAAIQDYNRGIIVGSQTFGKATGQEILPIDQSLQNGKTVESVIDKSKGFIKVTTEKLYRVTGKSLQGKGITPDVHLPDVFDVLNFHEANMPFSLPYDTIIKNTYYKPLPPIDRASLRQKSTERLKNTDQFRELASNLEAFAAQYHPSKPQALAIDQFCEQSRLVNKNQQFSQEAIAYTVKNNSAEISRLQMDEFADRYNKRWFEKLSSDMYLRETYFILTDLVTQKNP